ncbi:hypothetical protein OEZ60_21530 [Defluviimonas sp. WL0024]|uniref:Uncharacterized protein n=2 Tax=Albidovulum TaxID=205889 RepID=A0ABT3J963_9RHOB|nr:MULTISPECIES: hypothetical protein [Defluviimonas]MCU9850560.1 hypothetical protein [Defluviimonas sp. WL0024]MCW3784221.1 hypothetical protein [Defluviimonas salinarum]
MDKKKSLEQDLERHPVIAALEDAGKEATLFIGYLGTASEDGLVRLYPHLDVATYVEFAKEDVIHVGVDPDGEPALKLIYVIRSAKVVETRRNATDAQHSRFSYDIKSSVPKIEVGPFSFRDFTKVNALFPWSTCEAGCESSYREAIQSGVPQPLAETGLHACLSECPKNPFYKSSEIASRIVYNTPPKYPGGGG